MNGMLSSALIIGGNGFIGSSLVQRLLAEGCELRVLDPSAPRTDLDWSGVNYVRHSLGDPEALARVMEGVDVVFHLASTTVPGTSNLDPQADVADNLVGALNVLAAMRMGRVRRIVFLSSGGTVYGNPTRVPVPEDAPLDPISSYGVVKVAIEKYLGMYHRLDMIDPLVIRPSNPYGPRQSTSGVQGAIAVFLGKALRGECVEIWGDGEVVRDYVHVEDLIDLIVHATRSGFIGTLNGGSGMGISLNELLALIRRVTGCALPATYRTGRTFDVKRIVLDMSAAHEQFGWSPRISLEAGIQDTWNYLSKGHV